LKTNWINIKKIVREKYAQTALAEESGCSSNSCCGPSTDNKHVLQVGQTLGYSDNDLTFAPGEANLGLGCGNPVAEAELKKSETVVDLGSGAGFDAFLSARTVGEKGRVIGIDMTPEMVARAKQNARTYETKNVEFRLGEIEHLPVSDASSDVVMSNCVINLSPDKPAVFHEIFRILKPGGRISISDILRSGEIPDKIMNDPEAYSA